MGIIYTNWQKGDEMDYKGYKIIEEFDRVIIENVKDFNPVHIFECGQCFRWFRRDDESYLGVAGKKVVNVSYYENKLIIKNANIRDFIDFWFDYFDLGRDYTEVKTLLSKDEIMKKAIEFGWGIRLLKQDIWEALVSFVISANNRIPMIMKIVATISKEYGQELNFDNHHYYSFPEVSKISGASVGQLEVCKAGFRCRYISLTSQIVEEGTIKLNELGNLSTGSARDELMKLPGVGPKVADCVLLYSGTKYDVFPTDVWVKRVMEELYFKREASFKEIQEFSRDYFGELAGFAQQYLFYYARENKIGSAKPHPNLIE